LKGLGINHFEEFEILQFILTNTKEMSNIPLCFGCMELINSLYFVFDKVLEPYSLKLLTVLM